MKRLSICALSSLVVVEQLTGWQLFNEVRRGTPVEGSSRTCLVQHWCLSG